MIRRISKIAGCAVAVLGLTIGAVTTAQAGGYYGGHYGYNSNHYYGGHYRAGHHYYGGRHYRSKRHYRHGRGGGGKAAAIALGVIGGAIILNEISEDRARDRYYEARRADYYERRRPVIYDDRYDEGFSEGYERGRERALSEPEIAPDQIDQYDDDLDARLDGGPEPIRLSYDSAYDACIQHARNAMGNRGFELSAPVRPETAEDTGAGWKLTATVNAERGADSWRRAMYCEASGERVYLLELI